MAKAKDKGVHLKEPSKGELKKEADKKKKLSGKKIMLFNKSKSTYNTREGVLLPGTSREFSESVADGLLQSGGDIVRSSDFSKTA